MIIIVIMYSFFSRSLMIIISQLQLKIGGIMNVSGLSLIQINVPQKPIIIIVHRVRVNQITEGGEIIGAAYCSGLLDNEIMVLIVILIIFRV